MEVSVVNVSEFLGDNYESTYYIQKESKSKNKSKMATILITGANGTTGRRITQTLLKKGMKVRAGLHEVNGNSEHLKKMGAEVVQLDFTKPDTFKDSIKGMERIVLIVPVDQNFSKYGSQFVESAKSLGVKFILKLSTVGADSKSTVNLARHHFYRQMSTIRRIEITADNMYKAKLIRGFLHLYNGQVLYF